MATYSNVYRRLVAANRRLQELLIGLLKIPLLLMRRDLLNRSLRSIDPVGYVHAVHTAHLLTKI